MSVEGVDYAWSHPGGAALQRAGMKFACRYASNDPAKDISRTEADDLAAHSVWSVVVFESTATRARAGRAAGVTDAKKAQARASAAGMPSGRPLYFAIDYDAPEADQPAINAYFEGVASVIGLARTGAYGGYWPLSRLKAAGVAKWFWQTDAWSGSNVLGGRHIHQHAATVTINKVSCDKNTALTPDFGQWMPGKTPTPAPAPTPDVQEDDMAISDADAAKVAHAVAAYSHGDKPDVHQTWLTAAEQATAAAATAKALMAKASTPTLDAGQVQALAAALGGNPAFVQALATAIGKDLAARMQA
ncbi:glycoside hydrolase domain-containing protein [Streptomyces sp. NPDC020983]|uniref:glycoside hydrolase domain-containing protein n=1 Tax=Streptomyces sp. NPDC020983 TaxID=3365106 RepID=UPI00379AF9C1